MKPNKLGIDILGNIAILKFDRNVKLADKKKVAEKFLKEHKSVRTIVEKREGFSGRLRIQKTKYLLGEKTKEALYKENGCIFRFNIDTCYFSPRLSSERLDIARQVKKGENVLVMFGGVAPFAIVIAKNSEARRVVSVEIGRECNKYAEINVKRNKLQDKAELIQGDVRKIIGKNKKVNEKFDRIVMARPNLKDSFLDVAFPITRKGEIIHYYGFSPPTRPLRNKIFDNENSKKLSNQLEIRDIERLRELIEIEAKKARKKIKIFGIKKAGDIGPYRFRYRADIKVLN